jgi:peptide/nickel transport system substrate-binding protein
MDFSRRQFLRVLGLSAAGGLLAACTPSAPSSPTAPTSAPVAKSGAPAATAASGQAAPAAGEPTRGGVLRIGFLQNPTTLDPAFARSAADRNFYFNIYDTLVGEDPTGKPLPGLAESWEIAPDGKVYTFKLRQGVKFHDGTPFDAQAAKFNLDRILDRNNASPQRAPIETIQAVEAVDPGTLRLSLSSPLSSILSYLAQNQGAMASPTAIQSSGQDYARKPVGTGPFRLTEWVQDAQVTMERNPDYWDRGKPYLDKVVFQIVPDDTVRMTTLQAGSLDMVMNPPPQALPPLRQPNADLRLLEQPSLSFYELRLNLKQPPFDNKALREALWYAIDPAVILKNVLFDNGVVAQGPIPPSSWSFDPSFRRPAPDPAMAKQKLTEGGRPDGFEFTLDCRNQPLNQQMAEALAAQAAAVGIRMKIQIMEVAALLEALNARRFIASEGQAVHVPDPDSVMYNYYASTGPVNQPGYSNPALDGLLNKARSITALEQRAELYHQAQQIIVEDKPRIPTVYSNDNYVLSKKLAGVVLYADGMLRARDMSLTK